MEQMLKAYEKLLAWDIDHIQPHIPIGLLLTSTPTSEL